MNNWFLIITCFCLPILCIGSESVASGFWLLKWHFVNTLIVIVILYRVLKKILIQKVENDHNQFKNAVEQNEKRLFVIKSRHKEAKRSQSNMNTLFSEMEINTKESIQKFVKLKKQHIVERENQLKVEMIQRKENLEFNLAQKIYTDIIGHIIRGTKEEVKLNKDLLKKVEKSLIDGHK